MLTLVTHTLETDCSGDEQPLFAVPDGADVEVVLGEATKQAVLYNFAVAEYDAKRAAKMESLDRVPLEKEWAEVPAAPARSLRDFLTGAGSPGHVEIPGAKERNAAAARTNHLRYLAAFREATTELEPLAEAARAAHPLFAATLWPPKHDYPSEVQLPLSARRIPLARLSTVTEESVRTILEEAAEPSVSSPS